eukprot:TRINITY_DN4854_c0_g1_i4.p1 TRINITY_DN4854_c0_g1~~TRINITY_DN4854_c0_g1_i4.p1  ORF type:complete len:274 (-),score=86.03 TRINITY_DN4854_c0_g1_i4:198-1019(-)
MSDDESKVGFTLTVENSSGSGRGPKHFSVEPGSKKAIRIGRAPGNDFVAELRGSSQYHCELRVLEPEDDDEKPRLVVRDLSMNGTGLKIWPDKDAVQCKKGEDTRVFHETQILVPFLLKASQSQDDRVWLKVTFDEAEGQEPQEEKAKGSDDSEKGSDDEGDEKSRMAFVDLLMKTREISGSTTYEDAREILEDKAQWKAVNEDTRKECFDIFVEHLGSHSGKKKKKDKKSKKRKHKDASGDEDEEESGRKEKKQKKDKKKGKKSRKNDSDSE